MVFNSLVDGLGGEELNQPGSQVSQLWLVGSITTDDQISGANIYSTGTVQGENVYGDTTVSGATLKGTTISGGNIYNTEGELQSTAVGSPFTYGQNIRAGSNTLGAGSNLWIVFPTAFASAPQSIVATDTKSADKALFITLGSINAGSFYIEGPTASDTFNWIAVGL